MEKPEPVAVAVTYSSDKEKFLIVKRGDDRPGSFPGCWEFPGGSIEDGENPKEAALRELMEETGFIGELIREGESFEVKTEDDYYIIHPSLVTVEGDEPELSKEHIRYRWVEIEETEGLETVGKFRQDLVSVGVIDE
ncbi:MAG: NUDIX hydrolase [Candidatus Nanohaloarchaea archaeon]